MIRKSLPDASRLLALTLAALVSGCAVTTQHGWDAYQREDYLRKMFALNAMYCGDIECTKYKTASVHDGFDPQPENAVM